MVDVHNEAQRRVNMRAIRYKDTNPEMQIRRLLFAKGFRFRLHVRTLPGSPDIVLPKHRVTVFVHGCFWHGHDCHLFKVPATRTDFWLQKIQANQSRDIKNETMLLAAGWRILTIWECALKGKKKRSIDDVVAQMTEWILNQSGRKCQLTIMHR